MSTYFVIRNNGRKLDVQSNHKRIAENPNKAIRWDKKYDLLDNTIETAKSINKLPTNEELSALSRSLNDAFGGTDLLEYKKEDFKKLWSKKLRKERDLIKSKKKRHQEKEQLSTQEAVESTPIENESNGLLSILLRGAEIQDIKQALYSDTSLKNITRFSVLLAPEKAIVTKRSDVLSGGVGDNLSLKKIPQKELQKGIKVEKEHTNDVDIATDIVKDHEQEAIDLTGKPVYYEFLDEAEKKMEGFGNKKSFALDATASDLSKKYKNILQYTINEYTYDQKTKQLTNPIALGTIYIGYNNDGNWGHAVENVKDSELVTFINKLLQSPKPYQEALSKLNDYLKQYSMKFKKGRGLKVEKSTGTQPENEKTFDRVNAVPEHMVKIVVSEDPYLIGVYDNSYVVGLRDLDSIAILSSYQTLDEAKMDLKNRLNTINDKIVKSAFSINSTTFFIENTNNVYKTIEQTIKKIAEVNNISNVESVLIDIDNTEGIANFTVK